MTQRFYAHPEARENFANGAVGYRPSPSRSDCLGPFAKVQNCPVAGTALRLTCYATDYADTWFSVPAVTRYKGKRVKGYFSLEGGSVEFRPLDSSKPHLPIITTTTKEQA